MIVPKRIKELIYTTKISARLYERLKGLYLYLKSAKGRKLLRKEGGAVLSYINLKMGEKGYPYFANYGTLLGAIREKSFLRNDDDIDLSIPANSISAKALIEALDNGKDMVFVHAFIWRDRITEVTFLSRGIYVDFFFQYCENGVNYSHWYDPYNGMWSTESGERFAFRRPIPIAVDVKCEELEGGLVPIPGNAEEILTSAYGNWRIPVDKNLCPEYEDVRPPKELLKDYGRVIVDKEEILCRY